MSHVRWGQLRCGIRNQVSGSCAALACSGMEVCTCHEEKHPSRRGQAKGKTLSRNHRNEGKVLQNWFLFQSVPHLRWLYRIALPPRLLYFSFGKEFYKGVSKHMLLPVREISGMHVPTGWVTKTTLALEIVQVPVILPVQQMRNYSGTCSFCSNRRSPCSNELYYFYLFLLLPYITRSTGACPRLLFCSEYCISVQEHCSKVYREEV